MFASLNKKIRSITDHLIESPCIAICKMNTTNGLCTGCYRTLDEIAQWSTLNGDQKRQIIADSAARQSAAAKRT